MVPGLALWLPSGYSYGAALLLLTALLASPLWLRRPRIPASAGWLALAIVVMGGVWLLDVNTASGWRGLDKTAKYLAALVCLPYLLAFPPRPAALFLGIAAGAAGAGLIAVRDVYVRGIERAWGYSETVHNAIQYGNLSGLLGLMCGMLLLTHWDRWRPRTLAALGLCGWLGLLGSLLSQSRGGWLALALSLPLWAWLLGRWLSPRLVLRGGALLLATVATLAVFKGPDIQRRLAMAHDEVTLYQASGDANSSIGQRLDHWQLAWRIGLEKPLTGWGEAAYQAEKQRRVAAGQAHPFVLQFSHPHNELLDQFAKRGLVGVAALLLCYAVPIWIFWPTRARLRPLPGDAVDPQALALRLLGLSIPVAYIGFGLTQAFLAHNSGSMFYLFMTLLVFSLLRSQRPGAPRGA